MVNKVTAINNDASIIYEGGDLTQITADELKGNIIAIRQLINSHNLEATENRNKDAIIIELKSENEYLKTSPFVAILATTVNIIGSIVIGISTNFITAESTNNKSAPSYIVALVCGGLLVLIASFGTILYPKARKWFNLKK